MNVVPCNSVRDLNLNSFPHSIPKSLFKVHIHQIQIHFSMDYLLYGGGERQSMPNKVGKAKDTLSMKVHESSDITKA